MTKTTFVNEWKHKLAGLALFGLASERNDGPMVRASKVFELPAQVESLLGAMYESLGNLDDQAEAVIQRWNAEGKPEATVDRFRKAFTKNGKAS